eukprot:SM000012S25414  [mRNA]  locus=s12:965567:972015:- [translate_table: standard]
MMCTFAFLLQALAVVTRNTPAERALGPIQQLDVVLHEDLRARASRRNYALRRAAGRGRDGSQSHRKRKHRREMSPPQARAAATAAMDPRVALSARLRLWQYRERFVLEPADGAAPQCLTVARRSGELSLLDQPPFRDAAIAPPVIVFGLLGIVELLSGSYVIFITSRKKVGTYRGGEVFRVTGCRHLACSPTLKVLSPAQREDEKHFLRRLRSAEASHGLFFSYTTDLTVNTQKTFSMGGAASDRPLYKQADPLFFWNKYILKSIAAAKGIDVHGKPVLVTLIARRNTQRIGTRMWRRGADKTGAVANYVESEQIVEVNGKIAAFVQVRGSIPLTWEQVVNLVYKPKMVHLVVEDARDTAEKHFKALVESYGSVLVLDLINQRGSEGDLGKKYAEAMQALNELEDLQILWQDALMYLSPRIILNKQFVVAPRYVPFDFHRVCGHVHFERLSLLYDEVADTLSKQRYFLALASGKVVEEQKGVARTNCIDCLDRTNVTQSYLARRALEAQLRETGIFSSSESVAQHAQFDFQYKILWANHGDDISKQYSGTGALKGDFVRFGKRTTQGFLQDGINALLRYYYNNFTDGIRQDGLDLITGKYKVDRSKPSPFASVGVERFAFFPVALCLILVSSWKTMSSLLQAPLEAQFVVFAALWAGLGASIGFVLYNNAKAFCDKPHLCKMDEAMESKA